MKNFNYNEAYDYISKYIRAKEDFIIDIRTGINGFDLDAHFRREFEYDSNQRSISHNGFKQRYLDKFGSVYTFPNYFSYTFFIPFGDSKFEIIQHDTPWMYTIHFINR